MFFCSFVEGTNEEVQGKEGWEVLKKGIGESQTARSIDSVRGVLELIAVCMSCLSPPPHSNHNSSPTAHSTASTILSTPIS